MTDLRKRQYLLEEQFKEIFTGEKLLALEQLIEQGIATRGAIRINTANGLFEAYG